MKKLAPLLIALLGLGVGVGVGLALKPAPEPEVAAACPPAEGEAEAKAEVACPADGADPFAPTKPEEKKKKAAELAYVQMDKPFVVPIFAGEKVAAMVVVSLSVETDTEGAHDVEALKPRLRDGFLKVMFRHANSGGFDGSFTSGRKMDDLKSALLRSAQEIVPGTLVEEVLITEIARQDS
ncbi:flagellar basal body-associated FliL family protein [Amaricoccus sp.]|uniref:flagellar basal body-associated FliL family protein n=1 Tax=Amaricoccus sp. TaxID=1872485 RepID=UPI002617F908|nr:flagellar basal body-associated FliL family protein [Amaricoccus sp.]HRO10637.1 flagellar basal body-associated FliL family protein [Amaricoccus sp.]